MGLWNKGINRANNDSVRLEDDRTKMIEDFFAKQKNVVRYEIVDKLDWLVEVEGSVHLYEDDLTNGEMFFRIGKLKGDLYCHCKHFKQSVIPAEMGGEIVFVPDEEEVWKSRQDKDADEGIIGMECLTAAPTKAQVVRKLEQVFTDYIAQGYDIDFNNIIGKLKEEWDNKDRYELTVHAERRSKGGPIDCDISVTGGNDDSPLKLQVIEKALYLTFMLQENGIKLEYTTTTFWNTARKIYYQLSGNKVMSETDGIMSDKFLESESITTTINGYRSKIRTEIKKRISNERIVDEFAVEGYKNEPVFVKQATSEIREHIKKVFDL